MFLQMHWKNSTRLGFRWLTKSIKTIKLYKRSFCRCYFLCFYISMIYHLIRDQKQSPGGVLKKRCSWIFRKIYRKISVLESLFNKVVGLRLATLLKKRLQQRCFPVNFAKFLRTPSLVEHLRWLLLRDVFKTLSNTMMELFCKNR